MKHVILGVCLLAAAFCGPDAVAGWERPKTTRRYLQGPLAERLLVAFREGKVVHGEMCHDKDWLRWRYVCQPAHGVWLVHGKDDEAFDFRAARMRMDPEGIPIHGQSWRVGDLEVDFEACSPIERKPSAHVRVVLANRGTAPLSERIGFIIRNSQEANLVFGAPDIYRVYNPRTISWKGLDFLWQRQGDAIVLEDLFVSFRGDSAGEWDGENGVLRFPVELAAGETKTYDLVVGRQDRIVRPDYEAARERTRADWRKELEKAKDLPLLEKCLLVQILQCYARANKGDVILPRQGGLQRWVWPWDQSYASAALTMLGYGEYVEMACDFYFGEYARPDGMVGPFGMGWVNDTANVLGIFSRHCAESGNLRVRSDRPGALGRDPAEGALRCRPVLPPECRIARLEAIVGENAEHARRVTRPAHAERTDAAVRLRILAEIEVARHLDVLTIAEPRQRTGGVGLVPRPDPALQAALPRQDESVLVVARIALQNLHQETLLKERQTLRLLKFLAPTLLRQPPRRRVVRMDNLVLSPKHQVVRLRLAGLQADGKAENTRPLVPGGRRVTAEADEVVTGYDRFALPVPTAVKSLPQQDIRIVDAVDVRRTVGKDELAGVADKEADLLVQRRSAPILQLHTDMRGRLSPDR